MAPSLHLLAALVGKSLASDGSATCDPSDIYTKEATLLQDFWGIQWVDVVIWSVGFVVCAFASFGPLSLPDKRKQSKKQTRSINDGPLVRVRRAVKAAVAACSKTQISHNERGIEHGGHLSRLTAALEKALRRNDIDTAFDILKKMQVLALPIPANTIDQILQGRSPKDAGALLGQMQHAGVTLDVVMYNRFVMYCVKAGDLQCALSIVEEMRKVEPGPDVQTYNTLMKGFLSRNDFRGAKNLLREIAAAGQKPNQLLYNTLLHSAIAGANVQIVWDTIAMMKKCGVPADGHTAHNVMELLRRRESQRKLCSKDVSCAVDFLAESGINFSANPLMLSTMIDACMWHTEHYRLEYILEQYWTSSLQPPARVYGLLIKAASSLNNTGWVWKFWKELVERDMQPTATVLGCMLDALVRAHLVDEAVDIFQEWKASVSPSTIMYATLIKGFLSTNQAAKSMQMLQEMRSEGIERNRTLYNMVLGAQAESGSVDEFDELLQSMRTDGCYPDAITYSIVVKGHCVQGDIDTALRLLHEGQQRGIVYDAAIYNSIFFGCYRHNRHDINDELVSEVASSGLTLSSFTLTNMVKMYGSRGQLTQAFGAIVSLTRQPISADSRVVNALFEICTKNVDVDLPEHVFERHLAGAQDAKFFWPVIACRVLRGEFEQAQRVVKANRTLLHACPKAGTKEDLVEQLLSKLGQKQEQQKHAMKLIEKLRIFDSNGSSEKD